MFNALKSFGQSLTKYQLKSVLKENNNTCRSLVPFESATAAAAGPIGNTIVRENSSSSSCLGADKYNFVGKNCVYVGGMGGIGFATSKELVTRGIKSLFILDIKKDGNKLKELNSINPNTKIGHMHFDLCDGQEEIGKKMEDVYNCLGKIDILINGSSILNDREIGRTISVNLLGAIETTIAAVPYMSKAHCGSGGIIIYIGSILGLEPASPIAVYTAAKHGIVGFTKSISHPEYLKITGIHHITVCPGATKALERKSLVGLDTFDMSKIMSEKLMTAKAQSADSCGKNIVKIIETAKNGTFWLVDQGKYSEVKVKNYWQISFKDEKK